MGILGFLKRKSESENPCEKRLLQLKSKRINCCYEDFGEFISKVKGNPEEAGSLIPVNYYAVKNKYIEAHYFYSEDYSECYVKFTAYENDKSVDKSEVFEISTQTLVKAFSRVGIIIRISDKNE